ncbi:FprA family A-type flavoprotein [Parasporobacterium paucivorans]|uniref:Flavorubredoxin n=1 Tax=Parasporobacterium paucivorans DSM 15970 TaxID=1122934 RepID=A0A1M6FUG0_9FIRM|nr:FprA family A-type flavoprotein [Parasporobacterium paucivorans]SHJ01263.1 Flavorubredoxin [Parasporobacterium paucivorans DSM 15970]
MGIINIAADTFQITENIKEGLFEGAWAMPNGVSLNAYIIKGDKTAVIDGGQGAFMAGEIISCLESQNVPPENVDYLVINHMEPDHSGWLKEFFDINKKVQIVCAERGKNLLDAFLGIKDNIIVVKEGDVLDLGKGHVLTFTEIPNVHWPDTIASFDTLTKVLFSCDAFGGFGSLEGTHYADELEPEEKLLFEKEMLRYYSNILATFSSQVKNAVGKCRKLEPLLIAPGHGLMWRNTEDVFDTYENFALYQKGIAREEILLLWGSMYGMTGKAVGHVRKILEEDGIKVHEIRVPQTPYGEILTCAWSSTGVILAMPTYEYKMFSPMAFALEEMGRKKINNRIAFRFGSYGWSGGAQKELDEIMERLKMGWEFIEPVEFNGNPSEEELQKIGDLAKSLAEAVRQKCR